MTSCRHGDTQQQSYPLFFVFFLVFFGFSQGVTADQSLQTQLRRPNVTQVQVSVRRKAKKLTAGAFFVFSVVPRQRERQSENGPETRPHSQKLQM